MALSEALANDDTLLPTQMFPRLPTRAAFVADSNFVCGTQKMFLILFRNILRPQQMFPSLRSPRNIMDNNVSATMCPRLPGPYLIRIARNYQIHEYGLAEMDTDRGLDFPLSNALINHHVKTKKIISVKEVSIDFDDFTSPFTL